MTNTTIPHTAVGIVCGRCSTRGKDAIIRRHATVADVKACFTAPAAPVVEVAPQPQTFGRWMASCPKKGCKKHQVKDHAFTLRCYNHGAVVRVVAKQLQGTLSKSKKHLCNSACTGAVGPICVCQCGGKNHGAAHLVDA